MNTVYVFIVVVLIALLTSLLQLYFNYKQFQSNSYDSYSQGIKQLIDQRYQLQQSQIDFLIKIATPSGKIGP